MTLVEARTIDCDGDTIIAPHVIQAQIEYNGWKITLLKATGDGSEDADFTIPSTSRNVVGITDECTLGWVIEKLPDRSDEFRHTRIWEMQDKFIAHNSSRNVQLDPETGAISDYWPKNQLRIGETIVKVDGEIWHMVEYSDAIFISTRGGGSSLYAFESDGSQRWKSDPNERRGYFFIDDGALWERTTHNRTTDRLYRFDYETGERRECVEEIDTGPW